MEERDVKSHHFMTFLRIFLMSFAVSWTFFPSNTLQIDVNACVIAKKVCRILSNNGRKLGEFEGINRFFVDF